jgi:hypothetical protein
LRECYDNLDSDEKKYVDKSIAELSKFYSLDNNGKELAWDAFLAGYIRHGVWQEKQAGKG